MEQQMAYFDRSPHIASTHKTGVSLHSQTLHSRESAVPLGRCLEASAIAQLFVRRAHKRYGENPLHEDLSRMWWTPPLTPRQALDLEASQIVGKLGLEPIVSLSDHDSIAAPMQLQVLNRGGSVPVAVEWTVPFRETYSHVGVHNMDPRSAMASMGEMARFTAGPESEDLPEMLAAFDSYPGCLVVLNYPYWDQPTIGSDLHNVLVEDFMHSFRPWIHALEIHGLLDWRESQRTVALSRRYGVPLVSGGDRHAREPDAALNVTSASTFGEFAREVRWGVSRAVLMPQYRRPLALRIIENFADIVNDAPDHGLGWTLWTERVFRRCDDGEVRSLHAMCGTKPPVALRAVTFAFRALSHRYVKPALEWAMPQTKELG